MEEYGAKQVRHSDPVPSGRRERNYEQHGTPLDDDVSRVTVDAVVNMLTEDPKKVVADGGYFEDECEADGGYRPMKEVAHQPPEWTNMENPSL